MARLANATSMTAHPVTTTKPGMAHAKSLRRIERFAIGFEVIVNEAIVTLPRFLCERPSTLTELC